MQQVGRRRRLRDPGAEPAARPLAGEFRQRGGGLVDQRAFGRFSERALPLRIGAAVADDLGLGEGAQRLRRLLYHCRIGDERHRQAEFAGEIGEAEHADPVAIVAPGVIEHVGLRSARRKLGAEAFAEGEPFEIEADIDGKPLALRPVVDRARGDRRVRIAAVAGEGHDAIVVAERRNHHMAARRVVE